jgi:hypothetical protein
MLKYHEPLYLYEYTTLIEGMEEEKSTPSRSYISKFKTIFNDPEKKNKSFNEMVLSI